MTGPGRGTDSDSLRKDADANLEDARMRRQFGNLTQMAHDWASEPRARGQAPAWLVLERSMRRRARAGTRARVLGGAVLGMAAVAAVVLVRGGLRADAELTFVVAGAETAGRAGQAGEIRSVVAPTRVAFSDGSDVVLQPGARGRVVATTAHGARLDLEAGRARFTITHRAKTEWSVAAGPFTVVVHGTVFDVGWSADTGALEVGLISGAVTVRGPVAAGAVTVQPGQRLTARAATGETVIDRLSDGPAPSLVPTPPSEAEPSPSVEVAPRSPASWGASGSRAGGSRAGGSRAGGSHAASAVREVSGSWAARVASGAFRGVLADADALGVERCLAQVPAPALSALADAARYARRPELARRALLAERHRFAGTAGAHDAAFLIGRLADDTAGDSREALRWYDRYLVEADIKGGTYAAEALGRKMLALDRLGQTAEARTVAAVYLASFPDGPHAARATRLRARR